MRKGCLGEIEHRKDVRPKCAHELLLGNLLDRLLRMLLGRIIDKNVELAELLYRPLDRPLAKAFAPNVSLNEQALSPLLLYQPFGFLGVGRLFQIDHRHARSLPGKPHGSSTADATIATRNQGDATFQAIGRGE